MNNIIKEDIEEILLDGKEDFLGINESNILITGATGLMGAMLTRVFIVANEKYGLNNKIVLMVRNEEKARMMLGKMDDVEIVDFGFYNSGREDINYVVHMASPTQSEYLKTKPVEVLNCIVGETRKLFEFALKQKKFKKFLYMSSMEAYGVYNGIVNEDNIGKLDYKNTRTAYPLGKRVAEFYGFSYWKEYGLPIVNIRLAMCIVPGALEEDKRAVNMFVRMAQSGKNIEMNTDGKTMLNFIYATDAVRGIVKLMKDGEDGDMYNLVSDDRGKTIFDLASRIAESYSVRVNMVMGDAKKYAPKNLLIMDNKKIKKMGWCPKYNLEGSIKRIKAFFGN